MKHIGVRCARIILVVLICGMTVLAAEQTNSKQGSEPEAADAFKNLKFRNLGPAAAGGRVTAVVGIPGDPNVYYVGGAAGGVFRTTDGGLTWKAIFKHEATASIGDIALAPSNPSFLWVGTGEANIRNDVIDGHGVYFSPDGGRTWQFKGLADAGQISRIIVDPLNPQIVYAGVLGHEWAPNAERGVFRTTDGGKTWKKVLFVDDSTGVADLAMEPGNPQVLFAAMWHARRYPWTLVNGGDSSGIYRSTDGGDTWKKLTEGLPHGPLGRIGLAIAPSNPNHIYALIGAKKGMLWQSLDMGKRWSAVTASHALDVRPFYFSRIIVSPDNENKIYCLSLWLMESDDGGKTFHRADKGVHVDHHAIWIDPKNPARIIQGNDGGAYLSTDDAKTWRFFNALPLEQFYQVAVDSRRPFDICGGLQDNNAWCGVSSDLGRSGVVGADWFTVVGGDGEYAVPAPSDPDIVYADAQEGNMVRRNLKTHVAQELRPYYPSAEDTKPADLQYRFNWTSPIAVSRENANELYLGANVVFKSVDGGAHWTAISGDLTRNDKSKQEVSGGPVGHDISSAENYDTILSITIAPTDPKVIWVGTDDGLVHVTRDRGKTWTDVTHSIPGAPEWARIDQIGVSPFNAGSAYLAFDAHMLDDNHPYVYKTDDYGQTWTKITEGLPTDTPAVVVREDPNQRGLLVLGTETGLFYSRDRGDHWMPLKANFPTVPVWDLKFVKNPRDLVVATHGRGIFVLDDIRPLEEYTPEIAKSDFHLFSAGPGTLFHHWTADEGQGYAYKAPNAPKGVVVDYFLKSKIKVSDKQKAVHETPVKIVVTNAQGDLVTTEYGPSKAGINRFVWAMHYEGPRLLKYEKTQANHDYAKRPRGPLVVPGTYHVAVTVNGRTEDTAVSVGPDPNLTIGTDVFRSIAAPALTARNDLTALNQIIDRVDFMQEQMTDFAKTVEGNKANEQKFAKLIDEGKDLSKKLQALKDSVYNPDVQHDVVEDHIHHLARFHDELAGVASDLAGLYGQAPNEILLNELRRLQKELDGRLQAFNTLVQTDVAAYNKQAYTAGAPTLFAGSALQVEAAPKL